jgi:hypothetical protein
VAEGRYPEVVRHRGTEFTAGKSESMVGVQFSKRLDRA